MPLDIRFCAGMLLDFSDPTRPGMAYSGDRPGGGKGVYPLAHKTQTGCAVASKSDLGRYLKNNVPSAGSDLIRRPECLEAG